jgi:phage terminase large subunit-like protein
MISKKTRKIIYEETYNPIVEYWNWIQNHKEKVSKKVYKVYKELIRIIMDPYSEWEYNPKKANHAIEFIENYCKHSKGKMGGKPFILELWQKALVAATFGMVHKIDGTRKYQEVMLVVGRKNGKSTLAATIGLYMQIADGEPGAEIYACATKRDQAKIIWLEAKRMVKKSPVLSKRIKTLVAEMVSDFNDSFFRPLGRDSDSLDGLNVHGALLDEIHAWTDQNLYNVIVDGTTAREEPLIFITTTAGVVRECVYDLKYNEAERVINGFDDVEGYKNERFLPIIYELDNRDEWLDPECWFKANPGLGTIKKIDQLENKVNKAKANSNLVKNLLCKDFNIRETQGDTWLSFEDINNTETFDMEHITDSYAIGGADLSSTTDLTCATLIIMKANSDKKYVLQHYFMPDEYIEKRANEDKIPYDIWRDKGLLTACEGNKVNYTDVTNWFNEMYQKYGIRPLWIGYDPWNSKYWIDEMKNQGFEMEEVRQGYQTLSQPMKELEADLMGHKINYNNNPILKWCLTNVRVKKDENDNIRPIKGINQSARIDGMVSLLIAYTILFRHYSDYQNLL